MRFGMMQGRLLPSKDGRLQSFPAGRWREEFDLAPRARIECIEWLYDHHDAADNPLSTEAGVEQIQSAIQNSGIPVASICAHWFVEHPLLGMEGSEAGAGLDKLRWLGERALRIGVSRIVLPLEAQPDLAPDRKAAAALAWIERLGRIVGPGMPVMALELSFPLADMERLAPAIQDADLRVNYDIGNSAGMGLGVVEELDILGPCLGSIHLKDKVRGGTSVPLGQGSADFQALGRWLARHDYQGDLVLEAVRGPVGGEVPWTLNYRDFLDGALLGGPAN